MANVLKTISLNGEDWKDCKLIVVGMSATWRACGVMPQFFVEKNSEWLSPLFCFWFLLCVLIYLFRPMILQISLIMVFCDLVSGLERVIPFEMVLRGQFQGNC